MKKGKVIAFVGSGTSRAAGAPVWSDLLKDLIKVAIEQGKISSERKSDIVDSIDKQGPESVAGVVRDAMGEKAFRRAMQDLFMKKVKTPTPLHRLLVSIRFRAIFTTNFDCLIERAYDEAYDVPAYTVVWDTIADAALYKDPRKFYVAKLHGDIGRVGSVMLDGDDFDKLRRDSKYMDFLTQTAKDYTFIFLGYSLKDLDVTDCLKKAANLMFFEELPHVLLYHKDDGDRDVVEQRSKAFGIGTALVYDDHSEIIPFLRKLSELTGGRMSNDRFVLLLRANGWLDVQLKESDSIRVATGSRRQDGTARPCAIALADALETEHSYKTVMGKLLEEKEVADKFLVFEPEDELTRKMIESQGVHCIQICDLESAAARFDDYCAEVREQMKQIPEPIHYLQPVFRPEGEEHATDESLDAYVDNWMQERADHELWILGDFGTGKTTFCQHSTQRWLEAQDSTDERVPTPILIPLNEGIQARETLLDCIRKGVEANGAELEAGDDTVRWLLQEHRILVLCDGLDECPWDFTRAKQALNGRGNIVVTCRTQFFKTQAEYFAELGFKRRPPSNVDIVELLGVDERAIKSSISDQPRGDRETLERAFDQWPHLWEMARRPLWLRLILEMIPKEGSDKLLKMADLYDHSIRESLRTRMASSDSERIIPLVMDILSELGLTGFLPKPFLRDFSGEHISGQVLNAERVRKVREQARKEGGLLPKTNDDLFAKLIRQTILIHNLYSKPDTYSFGHLSFQEYLAARALVERAAEGECLLKENLSRTDWAEIACFYASLISDAEPVIKLCIEEYQKQASDDERMAAEMLFLGARAMDAAQAFDNESNEQLGDLIVSLFQGDLGRGYYFLEPIYKSLARMGDAGRETLKRNIERNQPPYDAATKPAEAEQMRRRCILAWYESFPSDAMEHVLSFLDEKTEPALHVRWHAAEVVAQVATVDNVASLEKYAESTDPIVQGNILWAFKRCDPRNPLAKRLDAQFISMLEEVVAEGLGKEHSFHPRAHGALLLGRCVTATEHRYGHTKKIADNLCKLLKAKKNLWRGYVTRGLLELNWDGAVLALCEYLKGEDDEIWQRYAVDAVVKLAKKDHVAGIEQAAKELEKRYPLLSRRLSRLILFLEK
ncbi:MAG: SIR2 family protein [Planctomycetota bacterium]|jgi:hypothetical protein